VLVTTPATLNGLLSATQTALPLSPRAKELLSRDTILVRSIDASSHQALFPMPPDEVFEDPDPTAKKTPEEQRDALNRREREWLRTAPSDERVEYRLEVQRVQYRTIALAALEPKMTWQEAERLGNDAAEIYFGILEFSGLLKKKTETKAEKKPEEPAPAADAAVGA
jgi:hypothetical protein